MEYNIGGSFLKAIIKGSVFALPIVISLLPKEWMDVTVGTLGYMLIDFLQKKFTSL